MSGTPKRVHDITALRHENGSRATTWKQDANATRLASTVNSQSFEACLLNGLDFGMYELVDPTSTSTANSNCPDELDNATSHQVASSAIANLDVSARIRQPFVLNDELEAEARRRRLDQPIQIPERRFGRPLSHEFSLKFRFLTSWHSTP